MVVYVGIYISQGYPTLPFEQQKLTIKPDMQQTSWIVGLNIVNLNVAGELFVHVSLVHDEHLYVYIHIVYMDKYTAKMYHCVVHVQVPIVYCMTTSMYIM